jgi:iron complex outermembrane recepter protein
MRTQSFKNHFYLSAATFAVIGALASPAFGAEVYAATDTANDEILVTANRRAESLQKVPIAVTAVSEETIRKANITETKELLRLAPTLGYTQGGGDKVSSFYVRGVGTFVNADGFDQSVGVAFDGVPVARPAGAMADLVDLERVEVLDGPQGMLFGKNASAGLINIITRKPVLGVREFSGRVGYGSYNEQQVQATVNMPLGDNSAVRASAWRFAHDGYVDNIVTGIKQGRKNSWGGRLRFRWQPTSGLDVNLSGEWTGADQDIGATTIRLFQNNSKGVRTYEQGLGIVASPTNLRTTSDRPNGTKPTSQSYTAAIDYDLGGVTLSSVSNYRLVTGNQQGDVTATSAPGYYVTTQDNSNYKQWSQELRLTSPADQKLRYVLGSIYFRTDIDVAQQWIETGSSPVPGAFIARMNYTSIHYAAFGEGTFDIVPGFRAVAGFRYSHDNVKGQLDRQYLTPPTAISASYNGPGAAAGPFQASAKFSSSEPSWRLGLQYDLGPDIMAYATASRGYKAGAVDLGWKTTAAQVALNNGIVAPEFANNYEVGVRSQFFDRRLTLNVTAFTETFKNFQVALRLPTATTITINTNAGELKSKGVTAQFNLRASNNLTFTGNAAYVKARFTDFNGAPCYPGEPTLPTGSTPQAGFCIGGVQTLNGRPLSNSPTWSTNLGVNYNHDIGSDFMGFADVKYRYQSSTIFNSSQDPIEAQGAYGVVDIGIGFGPKSEQWSFRAYGTNITKTRYVSRTTAQLAGAYYIQQNTYGTVSTYGVTASWKIQ